MFLRVILVSLLLGASIFIQIQETKTYFGSIQTFHYLLIAVIYLLTIIYVFVLNSAKNLVWFAYFQLLLDTFLITAIIYITGSTVSIFSFLYMLIIINGSIILYRRGGMVIASSSSILYGLLLDLHYYDVIQPLGNREPFAVEQHGLHIFYLILVNIAAFYLVAYLSSYLSEQTRESRVELKAKQIDLDKMEVFNESIINSITSGLMVLDGHNRVILFNPAAEEIFGLKADYVSGKIADDVLPVLNKYLIDAQSQLVQGTKKRQLFTDFLYSNPKGEETHIRLSISPLRLPLEDQKGSILIFQDMTGIKRIEEEMKKVEGLALVGEFAAGIAHEIRNPMASISGSIQVLKDNLQKDDMSGRLMNIVSREIDRLNRLVNDFLLFASPSNTNLQEFDLKQLVHESLELFQNSPLSTEKIEVQTDFPDQCRVRSDREQIKQVLWNLFLNACEAMPDGGILYLGADIEPVGAHSDEKRVKITVRDTGTGFDEKSLLHLFVPFYTTKDKGSGLGLPIVKRIIEGFKGEVSGDNYPEGGAEVTILLPIDASF